MMTFEQFQATRKGSDNLTADCHAFAEMSDDSIHPTKGNIYLDALFIQQVEDWWPVHAQHDGKWYLLLERDEWITNDLTSLERKLYEWAMTAGWEDEQ